MFIIKHEAFLKGKFSTLSPFLLRFASLEFNMGGQFINDTLLFVNCYLVVLVDAE